MFWGSLSRRHGASSGEDGLQIWRVAVNILNKKSLLDDKGCSPVGRLDERITNSHRKKKKTCYEM
jgi:hypothetical protein